MPTLVLDGYNVIHAAQALARQLDHSLEAARQALVQLCRGALAHRKDIQHIYVVFDGAQGEGATTREVADRLTVIFTPSKEEADDRILALRAARRTKTPWVIVSNDTYVFNNARAHGARVISVAEWMSQTVPSPRRQLRRAEADDNTVLPAQTRQAITDAYRKHLEVRRKGKA